MNEFSNMDQVLYYGLKEILDNGSSSAPRHKMTKEVLGYSFKLLNPRARLINIKSRKWNYAYAVGEVCWHLRASNCASDISYYSKIWNEFSSSNLIVSSCYGNIIFRNDNKDSQWEKVKRLLKADNDTRRAVLIFDIQDHDLEKAKDISCLLSIQFIVRDNKLNCITNMRSNDIIWGTCYDVFLITFLQEILAIECGFELGWYMHHASSYHIYQRHMRLAERILEEGLPKVSRTMKPIDNLSVLNNFLNIEEQIRQGKFTDVNTCGLSEYWKHLVTPLIEFRREKEKKANQ